MAKLPKPPHLTDTSHSEADNCLVTGYANVKNYTRSCGLILTPVTGNLPKTELPEVVGGFLPYCSSASQLSRLDPLMYHSEESILSIRPYGTRDRYGRQKLHLFRGSKDLEVTHLKDVLDLDINNPRDGQILRFNGGCWRNAPAKFLDPDLYYRLDALEHENECLKRRLDQLEHKIGGT